MPPTLQRKKEGEKEDIKKRKDRRKKERKEKRKLCRSSMPLRPGLDMSRHCTRT